MKIELQETILFCFVGPSGSGKSSICSRLIEKDPRLEVSISATSRSPRGNELNGKHYHFFNKEEFQNLIAQDLVFEWEVVHGNYYGTLQKTLTDAVANSRDILLDIDIKGAINFQRNFPNNTVLIFVTPPSLSELITRINQRAQSSSTEIKSRLKTAELEFQFFEKNYDCFDYFFVNENLEDSLQKAQGIVAAERVRLDRNFNKTRDFLENFMASLKQEISVN